MTPGQKFLQIRNFLLKYRCDYEIAYKQFRLPKFTNFNWAVDFFDVQANENDKTALWIIEDDFSETKISFSDISSRSNQVANFLNSLGIKKGDHILITLNNQIEIWETLLAAIKLGLVTVPASTFLTVEDLTDRIDRGEIKAVVSDYSESAKFDQIEGNFIKISVGGANHNWIKYEDAYNEKSIFNFVIHTKPSDPMLLYFTSGTTSKPKMVLHSHASYSIGHLSTMYWIGLQPGDIHLNISSPGWAKHAWSSFFAPWNASATILAYNYSRFDAKKVLDIMSRCKVSSLCAPPTVWRMFIEENLANYRMNLREIVSAGEPLNPEVIEKIRQAWNLVVRDGYGQTETTAFIGNSPGQKLKLGSMGRPLPGYKVVLHDPNDISSNEGEIALELSGNPIGLMIGYEKNAKKNLQAMRGGHYHTGDLAKLDADGYFTFIGRNDDVFKSSDYRISPFEIESILIEHEAVAEAAVVPSPDFLRLSFPKAFIKLRKGYTANQNTALSIFKHCRIHLSPHKRVRRLEFTELPKTSSGKIRRVELRLSEENRNLKMRHPLEFWEEDFPILFSNR